MSYYYFRKPTIKDVYTEVNNNTYTLNPTTFVDIFTSSNIDVTECDKVEILVNIPHLVGTAGNTVDRASMMISVMTSIDGGSSWNFLDTTNGVSGKGTWEMNTGSTRNSQINTYGPYTNHFVIPVSSSTLMIKISAKASSSQTISGVIANSVHPSDTSVVGLTRTSVIMIPVYSQSVFVETADVMTTAMEFSKPGNDLVDVVSSVINNTYVMTHGSAGPTGMSLSISGWLSDAGINSEMLLSYNMPFKTLYNTATTARFGVRMQYTMSGFSDVSTQPFIGSAGRFGVAFSPAMSVHFKNRSSIYPQSAHIYIPPLDGSASPRNVTINAGGSSSGGLGTSFIGVELCKDSVLDRIYAKRSKKLDTAIYSTSTIFNSISTEIDILSTSNMVTSAGDKIMFKFFSPCYSQNAGLGVTSGDYAHVGCVTFIIRYSVDGGSTWTEYGRSNPGAAGGIGHISASRTYSIYNADGVISATTTSMMIKVSATGDGSPSVNGNSNVGNEYGTKITVHRIYD